MGSKLDLPPPGFESLSVSEQIDYVQSLWDRIAAKPAAVSVPGWHQTILDERLADRERHPEEQISWDAVRADLEDRENPDER